VNPSCIISISEGSGCADTSRPKVGPQQPPGDTNNLTTAPVKPEFDCRILSCAAAALVKVTIFYSFSSFEIEASGAAIRVKGLVLDRGIIPMAAHNSS